MPDANLRPVKRALISVSDKSGLIPFAQALARSGVKLISTGGTAKTLAEAGLAVEEVSAITQFPEMLDGRVKTLHPAVHGGILAQRGEKSHMDAIAKHGIAPIDLVVVNLYPFAATVAKGAPFEECVENIDIGGPSLIRAAAKNHAGRGGGDRSGGLRRGAEGDGGASGRDRPRDSSIAGARGVCPDGGL